jgi:hypothetical protein
MRQRDKARCPWAKTELYVQYHDTEWGAPVHDDRSLFEFLILEGAQAGLSWERGASAPLILIDGLHRLGGPA